MRKFLLAAALGLSTLFAAPVAATVYNVSVLAGGDTLTLAEANATLVAGDIAILANGSYNASIAPANEGSPAAGFITYKGNIASPGSIYVQTINLTNKRYISVKGVTFNQNITINDVRDSLSYCVSPNGVPNVTATTGDSLVVYRCNFTGDILAIGSSEINNTKPSNLILRPTIAHSKINLTLSTWGPALEIAACRNLILDTDTITIVNVPGGFHGLVKFYGSRHGAISNCVFDLTNTRSGDEDEDGFIALRDSTYLNRFIGNKFYTHGPGYVWINFGSDGTGHGPGTAQNHWYNNDFRCDAPNPVTTNGENGLFCFAWTEADSFVNNVVIGKNTPFGIQNVKNSVIHHNTFIGLGSIALISTTSDWSTDGYDNDWVNADIKNNIFASFHTGGSGPSERVGLQTWLNDEENEWGGNYNLHYSSNGAAEAIRVNSGFKSIAEFCASYTHECNSIFGNPMFVGGYTGSALTFDPHLLPGSPAIGAASDGSDIGALPFAVETDTFYVSSCDRMYTVRDSLGPGKVVVFANGTYNCTPQPPAGSPAISPANDRILFIGNTATPESVVVNTFYNADSTALNGEIVWSNITWKGFTFSGDVGFKPAVSLDSYTLNNPVGVNGDSLINCVILGDLSWRAAANCVVKDSRVTASPYATISIGDGLAPYHNYNHGGGNKLVNVTAQLKAPATNAGPLFSVLGTPTLPFTYNYLLPIDSLYVTDSDITMNVMQTSGCASGTNFQVMKLANMEASSFLNSNFTIHDSTTTDTCNNLPSAALMLYEDVKNNTFTSDTFYVVNGDRLPFEMSGVYGDVKIPKWNRWTECILKNDSKPWYTNNPLGIQWGANWANGLGDSVTYSSFVFGDSANGANLYQRAGALYSPWIPAFDHVNFVNDFGAEDVAAFNIWGSDGATVRVTNSLLMQSRQDSPALWVAQVQGADQHVAGVFMDYNAYFTLAGAHASYGSSQLYNGTLSGDHGQLVQSRCYSNSYECNGGGVAYVGLTDSSVATYNPIPADTSGLIGYGKYGTDIGHKQITVDTVRPARITTLSGQLIGNSASLSWISVGDDSLTGVVRSTQVALGTTTINDSNFSSRVYASVGDAAVGNPLGIMISGLVPGTTYYFAVRGVDEANHPGTTSNIVSLTP